MGISVLMLLRALKIDFILKPSGVHVFLDEYSEHALVTVTYI